MKTTRRQSGDVTIVDVSGRISLGEESAALRDLIKDLVAKGDHKIVLNLAGVDYIDSSGLGTLVSAVSSARRQNADIKLVNLTDKVDDLMQVTRLYTVFDIADDEAGAVKAFDRKAAAGA
ncbi:MAG: STAS domain-containing protein [Candidatus Acidiferrum sp.]